MGRNSTNNDNSAVGAEFASVVSPNGFSTGDLVYRYPSGYGVMPSGAVSSATFPASAASPQYFQGQLETTTVGLVSTVRGGGQDDQCAAQLTNGNIVVVYRRAETGPNNANMFFVIVDQNNTVVVSETSVSASYVSNNGGYPIPISVIALTGGGFVVGWMYDTAGGGGNNFCWAIFDNVGNTIAGASTDTSFNAGISAYYTFRLRARPDGRWLVTTINSSYTQRTRVYNANGSTYTAWLTPGQNADRWSGVDAVVFSDSSFLTLVSIGNNIRWYLYNAAGTQLNTNTVAGFNASSQAGLAKLSTDVAVVYQATGSGLNIARFTLSTQTWSAVSSITTTANQTTSSIASLSVYTIPGTDNNIVAYTSSYGGATTDGYGVLTYSIINGSTGVVVGSQNSYYVRQWNLFRSSCYMVFIPISGYYRGFSRLGGGSSGDVTTYTGSPMPNGTLATGYIDIDASTYQPRIYDSVNASVGNTSALALGAYAKNASTPTSASFLAAATSTQTVSIARGTALLGQTVVDSTACSGYRLITLSTGNFIALYQYNSSAIIKFTVYNSSGVAQGTYTVATATISVFQGVAGCELADGKIVIAYHDTTSLIRYVIYSPSFTVLYTGSRAGYLAGSSGFQNNTLQVSPMFYNNYWIMTNANASTFAEWSVFDNTGTRLGGNDRSSACRMVSVAGLPGNNFILMWGLTAGSFYLDQFRGYGSSYQMITSQPMGTSAAFNNLAIGVSPFGSFIYPEYNGTQVTGTNFRNLYYINSATPLASAATLAGSTSSLTCGCSANGVAVTYIASADLIQCFYPSNNATSTGGTWELSTSSIITSKTATTNGQNATLAPLWGPYMLVGICNSSSYPTFSIIAVENVSYSIPITAGVTQSNPVTIDTSNGFSLIGVAASDCAAGGAGQVQTKGTAVLSSSYPTTTQTFDFTNPVTYGVKGTVSNRVITLED